MKKDGTIRAISEAERRQKTIDTEKGKLHTVRTGVLFPGVNLTVITTDKFKTGCLSVNFITELRRETASATALLPRVLRRGSSELPDMESLASALDDLYGTRVAPVLRKKGELHCFGLYADFPDERYLPGNESLLEKTTEILSRVLLSPALSDGLLRADYIESEKQNLIDDIRAAINDKRGYSISRLLEQMCAAEAYGVRRLGSEEEARLITPQSLTARYTSLINSARAEVLYCGQESYDRIESVLHRALSDFPGRPDGEPLKTDIILYPAQGGLRRFTETLDVSQGKLAAGFRLGKAMEGNPDYPAMMVFNRLYGAGDTSKLFLNVREKLSLCYSIGSMIDKHKGLMVVEAGVEPEDLEVTLGEILNQLDGIKKGDVTDWEFTSAKRSVISSVRQALDSPGGVEELYFDRSAAETNCDPAELADEIQTVSLDRIVGFASEISADSVYFLTGSSEEGDDGDYN